ncbi:MAG TPA: endolytic transglycosylase MltG [Actinomycetes bacterium]|nr:endolytic transglycosylase MltG [Actinomycetes bacterium]
MTTESQTGGHGRPPRRSGWHIARPVVVVALLLALLVGAAWFAVSILGGSLGGIGGAEDYPGPGSGEAIVEVSEGDTSADIASTLADANVVASAEAFIDAAAADDRALGIQPGFYALLEEMSAQDALDLMLDPAARVQNEVTVPEGLRVEDAVDILAAETDVPKSDFAKVLENPKPLHLPSYAEGSAEGFLFPATYTFDPEATAEEMLKAMVDRYKQAARDVGLEEQAAVMGYTPREAITVASLVQAEVAVRDFGKASRVIRNRLDQGMTLGFDSTVNYALGSDDLTLEDDQLNVDSPYNTYANAGLPPGPINSPGEAAMEAAVNPPEGSWLYFVAKAPGSDVTRFTDSYEEFLMFKEEFYAQVP